MRKLIKVHVTNIELDMIIAALYGAANEYEDNTFHKLAQELEELRINGKKEE